MTKSIAFFILFSMMAHQFSAQNKDQKRKDQTSQSLTKQSTESLAELIKLPNGPIIITHENVSRLSGTRNVYLRQAINGIEVSGTESSIHFDKTGKILAEHNRLLADIRATLKNSSQGISAHQAITSVAGQMGYKIANLQEIQSLGGNNKAAVFNKADISSENIPVKLMYYFKEGSGTQLVWELSIAEKTSSDWWNFRVNAATGQIIDKDNWTVSCNILGDHENHSHANTSGSMDFVGPLPLDENNSGMSSNFAAPAASYRVFAMPIESPNHGSRTLVTNPENLTASPYGWHDIDGVEGADFTYTRGNNTEAYDDDNDNNNPDGKHAYSPGGNLIFDFPLNTTYSNSDQSENAAVTNLFYWTNILHDVSYLYGFDEISGNFQQNNYGNGGLGNDPVNAEAQDGSGSCNANFSTAPDGNRPRMQMYICNTRDGDLDSVVIAHEYSHGISTRLTGGPANSACLWNAEQMGEGWSDFYGLMLTMKASDSGVDSRGIGTWLIGQGANGAGIRNYPYSTNFAINPHTYDDIKVANGEHDVGEVWATMLWEMTWEIMNSKPFDPNYYNGIGGNNVALALVTEGLKLQPCSPGFVDGRDAILAADQALYNGAHICAIWEAFARRGLGFSAVQGSTNSISDGVEAFDLPPSFSSLNVVEEVCLVDGIQVGLSGGNPEGGVYSGLGVTDDGNGSTFTFDPSIGGSGPVTISYFVNDFCTGEPTVLTDEIDVINNAPEIVCFGSGTILATGFASNNTSVSIPDGNSSVTSAMQVTDNFSITDLNVYLDITHSWVGDLTVRIKSPAGTSVTIVDRPGRINSGYGCNGSDIDAFLDDEAATPVENECGSGIPSISGSFIPNNSLSAFDGETTIGTWELTVSDSDALYSGTLNGWGIKYGYEITPPPLEVILDENGNATINAEDLLYSASVDCGTYTVLAGNPLAATVSFICSDIGSQEIFVEATNSLGLSATGIAVVIVKDSTGPIIVCPTDQNYQVQAGSLYSVPDYFTSGEATVSDNCTAPITLTTQTPAPGTILSEGVHVITLTATDEFSNTSTCSFNLTVSATVGVDDFNLGSLEAYPNPTHDILMLSNPQQIPLENMSIYDLRGRLIRSIDIRNMGLEKSIDVSEMASSIYFVIIKGKDGQITKKLIKE